MNAFLPSDILLPNVDSMEKWAVVACDQFSSQPEYWEEVRRKVKKQPSALHMILPEVELGTKEEAGHISKIQKDMRSYLQNRVFAEYRQALVYVERTLQNGKIRKGLVGAVDLEQYSYTPGEDAKIRATEKTVMERIPPRMNIRYHAAIELPHVILLCDDREKSLIEPLTEKKGQLKKLYEFDLMQGGGHVAGWLVEGSEAADLQQRLSEYEARLADKYQRFGGTPMIYAVGDGNHSLATAKACYEKLKRTHPEEDFSNHPARYALVELENLHDDAQKFEPIHRIITGTDAGELLSELKTSCCKEDGYPIRWYAGGKKGKVYLNLKEDQLAVDCLQKFLDGYLKENGGEIDYIHGDDVLKKLAAAKDAIGFTLPSIEKDQLFPSVMTDGTLPRKTFSMGHACEKRYYIEARKIRK